MQGTSRGGADVDEIVRRISLWSISMLFVIGGNGGNAAANAIHQACERKGIVCSVIGVPKVSPTEALRFSGGIQEQGQCLPVTKVGTVDLESAPRSGWLPLPPPPPLLLLRMTWAA